MNPFKELLADLRPALPYIGRWILDYFVALGVAVTFLIEFVFGREPGGSVFSVLWQLLLTVARYPAQLILTLGSLALNALSSLINNSLQLTNERGLNEQEIHYLEPIFGQSLNYAAIKIQTDGVKEKLKISPQAVGGDIFLRQYWGTAIVNSDLSLTPAGLRLLGHEACHVWQFQHGGAGYIGDSLLTQFFDVLGRKLGARLSDGYDLHAALHSHRACQECNVEQQAVMAEMIGMACSANLSGQLSCDAFNKVTGFNLDHAEFSVVEDAHGWMKRRRAMTN